MAEAIVLSIFTTVLGSLASEPLKKLESFRGICDELQRLENSVSTIGAVLLDAEDKYHTSSAVKLWLQELKHVFLDAEDLLDEISTASLLRQQKSNAVSMFFSSSNPFFLLKFMAPRIKKTTEKIDKIIRRSQLLYLVERPIIDGNARIITGRRRELTHSFVHSEYIIGREDARTEIVKMLIDSDGEDRSVSIIPVVGLGGLGKTALAQCVFNDDIVKNHFEVKLWACVSEIFDLKFIMRQIIAGGSENEVGNLEIEQLQTQVHKKLDGKKYLLILDDLWTEDHEEWLSLKSLLMGGAKGSKVLITTRSSMVAKISGTIKEPYTLASLSDEKSWDLFVKMAFKHGEDAADPELISIGKEIVGKCKGVPLAIRSLGGLLFNKDTKAEWLSIKDKELQDITQSENGIIPILKLSYDHLPSHLKHCFAICSLFPEDYVMEKGKLIRLWMALGFIHSGNSAEDLEGVGEEYFMDLARRNFFQDLEEGKFGDVVWCKMHDLMHNLAKSVARKVSTFINERESLSKYINTKTLHLSFGSAFSPADIFPKLKKVKRLRTVLLAGSVWQSSKLTNAHLLSLRRLRRLDLCGKSITELPSSISKLKHLRQLDLSFTSIKKLPDSIVKLVNLQTLTLKFCIKLEELPKNIERLASLRHLDITSCGALKHMPKGIGKLECLHTLSLFVLSKKLAPSKYCAELSELGRLNNLRGHLEIKNLASLEIDLLKPNQKILIKKKLIKSLELSFLWEYKRDANDDDHKVLLMELQPHSNLVSLSLCFYADKEYPSWIGNGCLQRLEEICLFLCGKVEHLPPLHQLPSLKSLQVKWCDELDLSGDKDSNTLQLQGLTRLCNIVIERIPKLVTLPVWLLHLTNLQQLCVERCENLVSLPEWIGDLGSLQRLRIIECSKLVSLPEGMSRLKSLWSLEIIMCPKLEEACQKDTGPDWHKIAHVPVIRFDYV